jgi:hypothetical protein
MTNRKERRMGHVEPDYQDLLDENAALRVELAVTERMIVERDAARAEVERLREAPQDVVRYLESIGLTEAAEEARVYIQGRLS